MTFRHLTRRGDMRSGRWVGGLALSCVLFLPLPAMAQHEKGDVSLAGAGSLTVQGGENSGVSGTVATTAGVFVAPNIEIEGPLSSSSRRQSRNFSEPWADLP